MDLKLYLTRHGETEWNSKQRLQGWQDSSLTKNGIEKAHLFKDTVKDVDFDIIYTSDQKRAVETAKIIKGDRDISIKQLEELRELSFGNWEGRTLKDIKSKEADLFNIYLNSPLLYKPSSGETISQLFRRVKLALEIIEKNNDKNVLVVSHGVTIKVIISILKNLDIEDYKEIPVYEGASLSIFEKEKTSWLTLLEGDTSHFKTF